jgi:polyhydroxybutyrate depolymerase
MRVLTAYEFDALADRNNFIVVYPDGFGRTWNDCRRVVSPARQPRVDDVGFIRALVDHFRGQFGVAASRVFAIGFSVGGQMAYRLALEAPDGIAGVGAVAANLPRLEYSDCKPAQRPAAVMIVNGTEDPVTPYGGGVVGLFKFGTGAPVLSTIQTVTYFSRAAGYQGDPQVKRYPKLDGDESTWVEQATWDAPSSVEVSLYTIHGGGHTIPQAKYRLRRILGRTNGDIDCMQEFWEFCQRQMRKGHE